MKILLVSFAYRPSLNPRAFRWSAIAEFWASQGHHVDVVCESIPGQPAFEMINGVHVYRTASTRTSGKPPSHNAATPGALPPGRYRPAGFRKYAKHLLRQIWRKLYWPDYAFAWYRPAIRRSDALLSTNRYDVMFSSSIPFTSHLVGLAMKRKRPDLKWVVDTGDPFCFSDGAPVNNFILYHRLNTRMERKVFSHAAAISVTTESTRTRYCLVFPFVSSKMSVIPPLLSPSFDHCRAHHPSTEDHTIRLVFVGTLYKDIRSPENLLRCFSRLLEPPTSDALELHFFGEIGDCHEFFAPYASLIGRNIFIHGLIQQDKVAKFMENSSILVNIGNNTEYQLPSKLVEYVAMMKPILNFFNSIKDSSAQFLKNFEGVLSIQGEQSWSNGADFEAVAAFVRQPPKINPEERNRKLQPFRIEQVAETYLDL